MKTKFDVKNFAYIAGMVLAWASFYAVSKWAVDYTKSVFLAGLFIRVAAFIVLTVYVIVKKEFFSLFKTGKIALLLLVIGVLGYLLDLFANLGFQHGSVSTGTVLLKLDVLMANFASAVLFKEKLHLSDWISSFVMLVGVVLVLNIDFSNFVFNWYDLFFIASALAVTTNAFVIKFVQQKHNVPSDTVAYYNNFVVMLLFLVSALVTGDLTAMKTLETPYWFYLLILLGGISESLIYIMYYRNLKVYEVWKVKLFLLFVPVISCFIGIFAFGETLVYIKIIGICVIILGAVGILLRDKINKPKIQV